MAKIKAELLKEAKKLKLKVTTKNTITEIQGALAKSKKQKAKSEENQKKESIKEANETQGVEDGESSTEPLAKSGKRSAKAIAEAEEKEAKELRKTAEIGSDNTEKPKVKVKPARSRLERRGKKYREAAKLIDKAKQYPAAEALELAVKTSVTKFDSTVEVHIRLGVDPTQADQNIRDNIVLPSGTGKSVKVAVFAEENIAKEALKAGADLAGEDDFLSLLDNGNTDFDVLIATPTVMAKLSKYARILGPKGLMPNPKSGTVTKDVKKAIAETKAGRVEYRIDSTGIIHVPVGKVSFGAKKLADNTDVLFSSIKQNKPASLKGNYVHSISITTSMGPSISVAVSELA